MMGIFLLADLLARDDAAVMWLVEVVIESLKPFSVA